MFIMYVGQLQGAAQSYVGKSERWWGGDVPSAWTGKKKKTELKREPKPSGLVYQRDLSH